MDIFRIPDLVSPGHGEIGVRVVGAAFVVFDSNAAGMILQSPMDSLPAIYECPEHGDEPVNLDYPTVALGTTLGIFPIDTLDNFPASDDARAEIAAAIEAIEEQAVRLLGMDVESVTDLSDLFGDDDYL